MNIEKQIFNQSQIHNGDNMYYLGSV